MSNPPDIIGSLATPDERRAGVQRAYDDGYEDGRLDIERELERRISTAALQIVSLNDQVDYWRNLVTAETHRLNALLALQIEQADEAVDEAYKEGHSDGWRDAEEGSGRDL